MNQLGFASLEHAAARKRTRRDAFLAEMDRVVPWETLLALIAPHYHRRAVSGAAPKVGQVPMPLATMLRIYCLQQWYQLSDPGAEEALHDSLSMRAFARLDGGAAVPDETTILKFRHLLERHDLTRAIFDAVAAHLETRGALLKGGSIVGDARGPWPKAAQAPGM